MEPISATVSAALAGLRVAKEMAKTLKQADMSHKLQEVYDLVADMRHEIFSLEDENRRLLRENETLQDNKEIEKQLLFENGVYWRLVGDKKDGPFCPYCRDADGKLVRIEDCGGGRYYCHLHKRDFSG